MNHSKSEIARTQSRLTRLLVLSSATILLPLLGVSSLQAQQATGQIEEIVVQGTATGTGIRGVAPVGSQTLTISRDDLLESPVRGTAEIISSLPQGSQDSSGVASGDGGNTSGAGMAPTPLPVWSTSVCATTLRVSTSRSVV